MVRHYSAGLRLSILAHGNVNRRFIKYDVITHDKLATANAKKQIKIKQKAELLHRYILLPYLPYEIKQTHWCRALAIKFPTNELKLVCFLILVPIFFCFAASNRAIVQLQRVMNDSNTPKTCPSGLNRGSSDRVIASRNRVFVFVLCLWNGGSSADRKQISGRESSAF